MIYLTPAQADAEFYRLVHSLLQSRGNLDGQDRRVHERNQVWSRQRVAPVRGSAFPHPAQFEEVLCVDISKGGLSFLTSKQLRSRHLVVELGVPPHALYVLAQVVFQRPVLYWSCGTLEPLPPEGAFSQGVPDPSEALWDDDSEKPEVKVQVGCRFIRKVDPSELNSSAD